VSRERRGQRRRGIEARRRSAEERLRARDERAVRRIRDDDEAAR